MTLGQRIRAARINRRMSISQVARAAGVDRSHLSKLERGKCSGIEGAGLLILQAVAEVIGTPIDRLLPRAGCLGKFEIQRRVK